MSHAYKAALYLFNAGVSPPPDKGILQLSFSVKKEIAWNSLNLILAVDAPLSVQHHPPGDVVLVYKLAHFFFTVTAHYYQFKTVFLLPLTDIGLQLQHLLNTSRSSGGEKYE